MKQFRIWDGDKRAIYLLVHEGTKYAHMLHVPTLQRLKMPVLQFASQLREGAAEEIPISPGLVSRIESARKKIDGLVDNPMRYSNLFVEETLAAIREDRIAKVEPAEGAEVAEDTSAVNGVKREEPTIQKVKERPAGRGGGQSDFTYELGADLAPPEDAKSGAYIRSLLLLGKSAEEILKLVHKHFADSTAKSSDVSWNKGKLREKGIAIPGEEKRK